MEFWSRHPPLHLELAIRFTTIETHSHDELQEEHARNKGEKVRLGGRVGGKKNSKKAS